MIDDVFCVVGAEILARKGSGCFVGTEAAALCLPCSSGSGGLSWASKGGGTCSSGCSVLSSALDHISVHPSTKNRLQMSFFSDTILQVIRYCCMLLPIITYFSSEILLTE